MSACERCNGTGLEDSGGVQPWGEPILVECECRLMERNMDESRKQFEAEMAKLGDCVDMRRAKNGDEEYMAWDVRLAWRFWNLSRAAIEIKLDDKVMVEDEFDKGHNCAIDYCAEAIRAAGIKVKE